MLSVWRELSVSQDRLHNLSCSRVTGDELSCGKGSACGADFRANTKGMSCWCLTAFDFPRNKMNPTRHFFLAFLLKFDNLKRFRNRTA